MIIPYSVAVDGYNSSTLSIAVNGYLGFFNPSQDGARPIVLSGFGGTSKKEDRIALIRAMDELDIPVIANFLIQFI